VTGGEVDVLELDVPLEAIRSEGGVGIVDVGTGVEI